MGEPEFFLHKKDRFPRPILSADEQESLTRKAEIPQDQTPSYVPEHVLSPEYGGLSNYELGVDSFLDEAKQKFEKLKNDPETTEKEILDAKQEITYLESLHENFYIGMNVFRTAKGGRDKIKS
jgi:colicin import membrane protein